jgi:hypothetical protein
MKIKLYRNESGIFLFSPPREIFPEFKLKLCFQNDLIRFIGDKLDKISKLILVCMRYFILIEISYFIRGDNL